MATKSRNGSRSKAQAELVRKVEEAYPTAFVEEEVYIGDLISERGYEKAEIEREMGRKLRRMFVDIVCRDSEGTRAFEYHGEQHYGKVGTMTATDAALLMNQQLDREKSWVLQRIGVPLVAVPYDEYVDTDVIYRKVDDAENELASAWSGFEECPTCGRFFPGGEMVGGTCRRCADKRMEEIRSYDPRKDPRCAEYEGESENGEHLRASRISSARRKKDETPEERKERLAKAKADRKARYQEYKNSEEYARRKEEARLARKEANRRRREEERRRRREQNG